MKNVECIIETAKVLLGETDYIKILSCASDIAYDMYKHEQTEENFMILNELEEMLENY